jgi:hypothetical protein
VGLLSLTPYLFSIGEASEQSCGTIVKGNVLSFPKDAEIYRSQQKALAAAAERRKLIDEHERELAALIDPGSEEILRLRTVELRRLQNAIENTNFQTLTDNDFFLLRRPILWARSGILKERYGPPLVHAALQAETLAEVAKTEQLLAKADFRGQLLHHGFPDINDGIAYSPVEPLPRPFRSTVETLTWNYQGELLNSMAAIRRTQLELTGLASEIQITNILTTKTLLEIKALGNQLNDVRNEYMRLPVVARGYDVEPLERLLLAVEKQILKNSELALALEKLGNGPVVLGDRTEIVPVAEINRLQAIVAAIRARGVLTVIK